MRLPKEPPKLEDLIGEVKGDRLLDIIHSDIANIPPDKYLHWEELRRKKPPTGYTIQEWWMAKKFSRRQRKLNIYDKFGKEFGVVVADSLQEMLHHIDSFARGSIDALPDVASSPQTRDRYLISSLFEEAITSSQLEGASTTHRVAKDMLRQGRKPRNRSERMITNNYRAMNFVREISDQPLTPQIILELHEIVTEGTLDDDTASGRLRTSTEDVRVVDVRDNTTLHDPPDAKELNKRLKLLCDFANGEIPKTGFLHPVIRAIIVHFLVGYDHPFVDGNGRTARVLFYWSMVSSGYWLAEYLSISTILRQAPSQYARAYLYTESDEQDATYFVEYNLRVIIRAIDALHEYLKRKTAEMQNVEQLLHTSEIQYLLNYRQIALLGNALKDPGGTYTIKSHMKSHDVTYQTARTDLMKLAEFGLLDQSKRGKTLVYRGKAEIRSLLEGISN